jgi:pre-mRNA cleavage complex 2 protein Pcf11
MEEILDQLQSDMENELDKVSLERLADLNPKLLGNIKQTAEANLEASSAAAGGVGESGGGGADGTSAGGGTSEVLLPPYFVETRSQEAIEQSKAWSEVKLVPPGDPDTVVSRLRDLVNREKESGFDGAKLYTQQQAMEMTRFLAGALAAASVLQSAVQRMREEEKEQSTPNSSSSGGAFSSSSFVPGHPSGGGGIATGRYSIDKLKFTNRGVKERDDSLIGMLYEIGLPFLSSVDGRRFATQGELSAHLDALFRRNQLEKAITRTDERGWYIADVVWTMEKTEDDILLASSPAAGGSASSELAASSGDASRGDGYDPQTSSVPADETRDRCVVCGINFKMVFDDGDGIYKYANSREIEMLNDDAADLESEQVLVHVTCWRGLGSPEILTSDQALHETLHRY